MAGQHTSHGFAVGPQVGDGGIKTGVVAPGRANRGLQGSGRQNADQFLQVKAEACSRPVAAKHRADFVITAASSQFGTLAINGKTGAAVIGITAQVCQVKADLHIAGMGCQPFQIS